jgi:sialate O-acetylesterase
MNPILLRLSLLFGFIVSSSTVFATVKLPRIFSDNMVIQRDQEMIVWGWADKGENITVNFNGASAKAKAGSTGKWNVKFKGMPYGGPYQLEVSGKNKIALSNILIGDVWLGSGQSNMEWIIKNTNDAEREIAESNYPKIRLFTVEKAMSYKPKDDLKGGRWMECNPQTIGDFSAVAYFFGRKLQKELNVPIGLINSSWGGTNIETWISWDVMAKIDGYKNVNLDEFDKNADDNDKNRELYLAAMNDDKGLREKWYDPKTNNADWKKIALPNEWGVTDIGNNDGIVWFRKEFELPPSSANVDATISLGPIDDVDNTYVNGTLVGSVTEWNKDRTYQLKSGILKPGKNVLVVKVTDNQGGGGIYGKPEQLFLTAGETKIPLAGEWLYKSAALTSEFGIKDVGPNSFPSQLYNAMIAPLIQFKITGVIWYQGEANTNAAFRYRTLFADLIKDWRSKWGSELTFLWVQLANFMEAKDQPEQSEWAELREAQSITLGLPKTGQAVIIDIGQADDIHPRNKQDVGYRLALAALKVRYGKDIVYSGPVYESMAVDGNKIVLRFSDVGKGLTVKDKYGYLRGFAIAGKDEKFVWAKAFVDGDKVVVYSDSVKEPVAVRYGWANNPDANLYNAEGLPASPFRTDNWKGLTEGK